MTEYLQGNVIRCSTSPGFTSNGTIIDPTNIYFSWLSPNGVTTLYTYGVDSQLVRDGVGIYHVDIPNNLAGTYIYRFYSTGTGQASAQGQFYSEAVSI